MLVFNRFVSRKAVSPLIAGVLLLIFTVAVGTTIATWMFDYTKTTTTAATEATAGDNGVVYCANSNVGISNVDLKTAIKENTSMSSGDVNYFTVDGVGNDVNLTFSGRSNSDYLNGLVGRWPFDDDAFDSSINTNDGVVSGAVYDSGKFNSAIKFDGVDDLVTVSDDNSLDITDDITMGVWVKKSAEIIGVRTVIIGTPIGTAITDCTGLQNMRNDVTANYYLANNIDCSATSSWNSGAGFEPVGNNTNKFIGLFDGQGYNITDLYINRPATYTVGLFGYTDTGVDIRNVGLTNINITANNQVGGFVGSAYGSIILSNSYVIGIVSGVTYYVGGLVGFGYGLNVVDSYVIGSVLGTDSIGGLNGGNTNGGSINNSYFIGNVTGTGSGDKIGGLVGENVALIANSYSDGVITGNTDVGGLIGYNDAAITNSYSKNSVSGGNNVGGLIGTNNAGFVIDNSYSSADVTMIGSGWAVGGLAAANYGGSIIDSYATGDVIGFEGGGGLVGDNSGSIIRSYSTGNVTMSSSWNGGLVGWNAAAGTITNSYSTGVVNASTGNDVGGLVGWHGGVITNSYSIGSVIGSLNVGGLVGNNNTGAGTSINSFWDLELSGVLTSAGGVGKTTVEMKQQATFTSWDFGSKWSIEEGITYPFVQWQWDYLLSKGRDAYSILMDRAGNVYGYNNNGEISTSILTPTNWHHYALTFDGSVQKIYVDGVLKTTKATTGTMGVNSKDFIVGEYFNGTLDEVRIYNRVVSQGEITTTYNIDVLAILTTNPKASINGNANVSYDDVLADGVSRTIEVNSGNFTVGQNNITIYTDSGVVDYLIGSPRISAVITNTGANEITVKRVAVFKTDGTNCMIENESTTFDVGDMFSVSGCATGCDEFTLIKAYTDCSGVSGEFSGTMSGC